MTYIEFYDKNSIENLCACLAMHPDEVILVGDNKKAMKRHIEIYDNVFKARKKEIKFSYKSICRWNTAEIIEVLEKIVENYDDCVFGITGGDEMVVFAIGMICERYANTEKKVQVHKISINNNEVHDCDMDGEKIASCTPFLTVDENIQIYGGKVLYDDVQGENTYLWDMTTDFKQEIEDMWSICKKDTKEWNKQIGVFSTIKKVGTASEDGLTITANIADVVKYYAKNDGDYRINRKLIAELEAKKLLADFKAEEDLPTVTITYKNLQVKKCLTQAGLALEMKIYKMTKEIMRIDGKEKKPLYNDVMNGVQIDWDGIIKEDGETYDTRNEIDVILMHNMIPIFVSCKNGEFDADELYKLNTVAERFGGKYARKVLVASSLKNRKPDKILKQRAQDMRIKVIDKAQVMNDNLLMAQLENLWR